VTGDQSTRNLRRDEHITTEEPLELRIADSGKITVDLASLADSEGRPTYSYRVTDSELGVDHKGADIRRSVSHKPDSRKAADSLLSFLTAAGEAHETGMDGRSSDNSDLFPRDIAIWAYVSRDEIATAQMERIAGRYVSRRDLTYCPVVSRAEDDIRPHISPPELGCRGFFQRSIFGARDDPCGHGRRSRAGRPSRRSYLVGPPAVPADPSFGTSSELEPCVAVSLMKDR
jgi:hypothetical protein